MTKAGTKKPKYSPKEFDPVIAVVDCSISSPLVLSSESDFEPIDVKSSSWLGYTELGRLIVGLSCKMK
jgi:hypothetical protein